MGSAGNTARAFAKVCSENNIPLMLSVLHYMEMILDDRYLLRRYINCPDDKLSKGGVEIRKNYRRLVSLRDEFESVRKSRQKPVAEG